MPLDQNPHQTATRLGCVGFSMYPCGFSVPQMRQFCLYTYPPRSKWASFEKMFFFPKSISSVGQSQAYLPKRKRIGLNFVWHHTKVFMQNSPQWYLRNVQLLRKTVNWCWWRFTHTFCHSSNILGCKHWFWLFTLCFIDEDASFFHFLHKITNTRLIILTEGV